ncbi:MAG: hypothetical protein HQ551_00200 [Desulfobacteraceae bacterium]|nr:hypothetical protein [Desulfobacteraceae bacterium]
MKADAKRNRILIYRAYVNSPGVSSDKLTVVASPLSCLNAANEGYYDLIAIVFDHKSLRERDALIELCSILKRSRHTAPIPILSFLPSRHRELLESLRDKGVEYARFYDLKSINLDSNMEYFTMPPDEECGIDKILSGICPYIHYSPIRPRQVILFCGAYRDRLVLGTPRLRRYCEVANYKKCRYFKNPRLSGRL